MESRSSYSFVVVRSGAAGISIKSAERLLQCVHCMHSCSTLWVCDWWLPCCLCRMQRFCLQVQFRPKMEDALPWAKEVLRHLKAHPPDVQRDLVVGPLESIRHGLQHLLSVLPLYSEAAISSATVLAAVLTTVRFRIEDDAVDKELEVIPMGLPKYPEERYQTMVRRIELRDPAMIHREISQALKAWDECSTIIWCSSLSTCHWHMSVLLIAMKDALEVSNLLL